MHQSDMRNKNQIKFSFRSYCQYLFKSHGLQDHLFYFLLPVPGTHCYATAAAIGHLEICANFNHLEFEPNLSKQKTGTLFTRSSGSFVSSSTPASAIIYGRVVSVSGSKTSVSSSTPTSAIIYDAYTSL